MELNQAPSETTAKESTEATVEKSLQDTPSNENVTDVSSATPLGKADLIEALQNILQKDGEEIKREDVSCIKQQFANIRRLETEEEKKSFIEKGGVAEEFVAAIDPLEQQMLVIVNDIKQKKAEWVEQRDKILRDNLELKEGIIEAIESLAKDTDNVNRSFTRFKELTQQFREAGDVPQENSTLVWKRFLDAEQLYYDQLKINQELRDYDFKKNLEIKTELIDKAEALALLFPIEEAAEDGTQQEEDSKPEDKKEAAEADNPDIVSAFKQLQDLHDKWKLTGPVAKELREDLWQRFRNATVRINKVYQSFFEERKATEKANEAAKIALCEKVEAIDIEAIKTVKDWEKITAEVIELQKQWKNTGFTSRKTNTALYNRFRTACDQFFIKKAEYFNALKETQNENLRKKTELAQKAEALKDSEDWNATAAELTRLQNEWKTIGAIPRKQSDALWERFHSACDEFFSRRKEAVGKTRSEEKNNLKLKTEIIEELKQLAASDDIEQVKAKLNELQAKWKTIGFVPFKEKNRLSDEYREAVNTLRRNFNLNESKASFERFKNNLEEMSGDSGKLNRERDRLFRVLENKRADLANYLNNMGFLTSKSKSGDGLLKEIEHKIELIKNDIKDLEQKITHIDSHL